MAKSFQSYTNETPIAQYRTDFMHRGAVCGALKKRYPDLAAIGAEADAVVAQIDARMAQLQQAEDDQIRARAIEDAEKLDVVDVYTELRRTLFAKRYDVQALLPDAPSTLGRMSAKSFRERAEQAIAHLKALPDTDPVRAAFLPTLEAEFADFRTADDAEDTTRNTLAGGRMSLGLYKAELSQAREAQLGAILKLLRDSDKLSTFALPWRKPSRDKGAGAEAAGAAPVNGSPA